MEKGTSEIAKLTERLSKDPKSKLFVPLAEEYKKIGDIEMAMAVLTEGLKNNPGYVTAKSFLGRLLLDTGELSEAQKEFEEVIKAIPDNVLAQRKLGDIHVLQGRAQEALLFFKAVLAVNPRDLELNTLVADIEAGIDVRGRIPGPKYLSAAGQVTAAVPTQEPSVKSSAVSAVPPSVKAEEPEEVLVFESLDEATLTEALRQPQATQDMFAELASETGNEEAARMDEGLTGGEKGRPVSGGDADMTPELDFSAAGGMEHESDSMDAGSGNRFFDSEPMQDELQTTADVFGSANEPVREISFGELTDTASSTEPMFFDVEPVEAEAEPWASKDRGAGEEPAPVTLDVSAPEQEGFVSEESSSDSVLFDVEPSDLSAQTGDGGLDAALDGVDDSFEETTPDADDFTTDTLAELYIAQGFYEKAIEIYERRLVDRPNSKLLKDKLDNVRAMSSASSVDEEQGTPVFFEAPEAPPAPSPQPVSEVGARQWKAPGVEAEANEYIPPLADDFESAAFDSGFAPVEYVLPEAPGSVPLPASPKTDDSRKEQSIAKLENWLKNIKKEK